jgi:pimeloyl-ACP methyl ester carboxylesterase
VPEPSAWLILDVRRASDEPATQPTPLSAAELKAHPEYEHVIWPLKPEKSGKAEVGKGRGSPAEIYWEIHGKGPICLVCTSSLDAGRRHPTCTPFGLCRAAPARATQLGVIFLLLLPCRARRFTAFSNPLTRLWPYSFSSLCYAPLSMSSLPLPFPYVCCSPIYVGITHLTSHKTGVMGLGALHTAWQRQTLHFSHAPSHRSKYTSLILDNRGVGKSTVPLGRYSTSVLASDILEILDAISWTGRRQLHIIGVSMGGMIAQELGLMIPDRIASLIIVSSAARLVNTMRFWENLRQRINLFIPKAIDPQLAEIKVRLFGPTWIHEPDDDVNYPGGGKFPTNGDRFAAQELDKRSNPDEFSRKGFILQAIAAGWHHKSAVQLKELGDKVGRDRITVMHGEVDRMISFPHGEVLAKEVGVELMRWENCGHVLMMEKRIEFNNTIEGFVRKTEAMGKE